MKQIQISQNKLKRLLRSSYEKGLNEYWDFNEWVKKVLEELDGY